MFRVFPICVLAACAAGLFAGGPAQAQSRILRPPVKAVAEAPEPPQADAVVSGVEITAPRIIERSRTSGVTQEMTMSARVPYGDLDMQSGAGVAELNRRVDEAAKYVCRQLDLMYPSGQPDAFSCVKNAVGDAQPQVKLAQAPK